MQWKSKNWCYGFAVPSFSLSFAAAPAFPPSHHLWCSVCGQTYCFCPVSTNFIHSSHQVLEDVIPSGFVSHRNDFYKFFCNTHLLINPTSWAIAVIFVLSSIAMENSRINHKFSLQLCFLRDLYLQKSAADCFCSHDHTLLNKRPFWKGCWWCS